jgi:hypothetical protein
MAAQEIQHPLGRVDSLKSSLGRNSAYVLARLYEPEATIAARKRFVEETSAAAQYPP